MTEFRLIIRDEVRKQVSEWYRTMNDKSATAPERASAKAQFEAFRDASTAAKLGQDDQYKGKRLSFGNDSHDLSNCAEYKVRVGQRRDHPFPNFRLIYREFEDPWRNQIVDGRAVSNPDSMPYREIVAFEYRGATPDPASVAGQRLGRTRGMPEQSLRHVRGEGPSIGAQRPDAPRTPPRLPMPPDVMRAAEALYGVAGARGAVNAPNASGQVAAKKADAPGKSAERTQD